MRARFFLTLLLVILGVAWRIAPHPWNFAPVGAIALFAGATFDRRRDAFFVPLLTMFAGDTLLEFINGTGYHSLLPLIYATYALIAVIGMMLRERRDRVMAVAGGATLSALLFFAISNLGVYLGGSYGLTFEGLIACYVAAIPFFPQTLASDLLFSAIFFGAFVFAERRFELLRENTVVVE
ncbi:MAG: DUF6580 family putative transport protein [Thermoanaerobaculia bacterium]